MIFDRSYIISFHESGEKKATIPSKNVLSALKTVTQRKVQGSRPPQNLRNVEQNVFLVMLLYEGGRAIIIEGKSGIKIGTKNTVVWLGYQE